MGAGMLDLSDASEHLHQASLVSWFRKAFPGVLIYAIPNGGKRGKREAMKLKAEGVTAGVPDLHIPEWGLWLEMKTPKGRLSADQKKMIPLIERFNTVLIGYGCLDAQSKVKKFAESNISATSPASECAGIPK